MSDPKLFNYWQNVPPSPFAGMVEEVMKQISEHKVTRGEIKDMREAGFHSLELEVHKDYGYSGYYVIRPKSSLQPSPYYVKVFMREEDAWQDAWIDYAVYVLIPKSLERKETK